MNLFAFKRDKNIGSDISFFEASGGKVSNRKQTGLSTFNNTLLFGVLMITPIAILAAHIQTVSAETVSEAGNVCVIASLRSNPAMVTYHGACTFTTDPVPTETASSEPSSEPSAEITPEPTSEPEPIFTATATPTPEPSPTATATPTATASPIVTATPIVTTTSEPTPSPTATTTSETPAIPPENRDPNTKEFRFCHQGATHSNSYTGMMAGHHDKHPEDIIPPIPFKFYEGWNWNAKNAETFYNNCVPVT